MLFDKAKDQFIDSLKVLDRSTETINSYGKDLEYLKVFLQAKYNGPIYVEDIKKEDLENFLLYQKSRGLKSASRSRNLYTMRSFFKYLRDSDVISKDPAVMLGNIKVKSKERVVLNKKEVYELYNEIEHEVIKVVVIFLYYTGLRISEATNLNIEYIDIKQQIVKVVSGKGNKDRIVPINEDIVKILKSYIENTRPKVKSSRLFATKKTGVVSPQYVNREIQTAVKKLGWDKPVSAHILRHSYATALIQNDVNIVHVSKLLGHSSIKTTSLYTHSNIDELKKSVSSL